MADCFQPCSSVVVSAWSEQTYHNFDIGLVYKLTLTSSFCAFGLQTQPFSASPCPSPKPGGVGLGLATATPSTATTTAAPAFSADIAIAAAATAAGPQSVAAVVHRARYSSLRTGVLRLTPDSMKCKLYCRGVSCKYCTDYAWAPDQMALRGLYSAWVTPDILAMARPTSVTVEKHDLIKQFKE